MTGLGFGIVGTGFIAGVHAQAIAAVPGARLVGVAARSPEKTAEFARRHGAGFHATRVEELVARPDLQVVCVATPSGGHLEPALAAIGAGKHVIVEKPLEVTIERVDRLLIAAEAARVQVGAIFQGRFGAGARALKQAVEAGRFGRIALASARVRWYRTPEYYAGGKHGSRQWDGGGALMNQAIHAVDLLQWCAGLPRWVHAWKERRQHTGIEVEDTLAAALRFPSGALGTIEACTAHFPGWSRRIEIGGENGSAALEDDRLVHWQFREAQPEDEAIRSAGAGPGTGGGAGSPTSISIEGHVRQFQDFAAALREGRPPLITGRGGRDAVALVCAIYESAESGAPVELNRQSGSAP